MVEEGWYYFPVTFPSGVLNLSHLECIKTQRGLKYGVVSNLAIIYDFFCAKRFYFFTFKVYYCLFSVSYDGNEIIIKYERNLFYKGGEATRRTSTRMGASKNFNGEGAASKAMEGFF